MESFLKLLGDAWLPLFLAAVCSYALGSVSFAIIVTRIFCKTDIRDSGSGNAGATNVLRSQGKLPALLTTLGDLGKAFAAVLVARFLLNALGGDSSLLPVTTYLSGLFCVLGHLYPLYFGFRGGKGVMATLGVMLVLDWKVALICLVIFIILVAITRMVSLGSVAAAAALPLLTGLFNGLIYKTPAGNTAFCTIMAVIIGGILIIKHRANIKRILDGSESKIGSKKEPKTESEND